MINRTLIRIKIVQILYAYYLNGVRNVEAAKMELMFSLAKAHDLYCHMLMLMVDVTRYADEQINDQETLHKVAHKEIEISHRFIDNLFVKQLNANTALTAFADEKKYSWMDDREYLKTLYTAITESDFYAEYMAKPQVTYDDDRELWRKIYKNIIMKDEEITNLLEDKSLYWNDDRQIVDTFVLKTIKRFEEQNGADQEIMPEFRDEEDREFAVKLITRAIENDDYYQSLISQSSRKWDFSRIAYMDLIIMQIALAEILTFPEIPVSVSINEFVEMARCYSTSKSPSYVNGILDGIAKRLKADNKLLKQYK